MFEALKAVVMVLFASIGLGMCLGLVIVAICVVVKLGEAFFDTEFF